LRWHTGRTCSILHRHIVAKTAREDQVARQIPAKRGTVALLKTVRQI
jgi:hypothetical protein